MNKTIITLIILSFLSLAAFYIFTSVNAAPAQADFPIDVERAVIISDPNNLMTHVPSTHITENGEMWIAYYRDLHNNIEDPKYTSIELVLSRFDLNNWESAEIKHTSLMKVGQKLGSFTHGLKQPPYDPALFYSGDTLRCAFLGDNGEDMAHLCFDLDPETGCPVGEVKPCTLTYVRDGEKNTIPLTATKFKEYYATVLGITNMKGYRNICINKRYTKVGDWYYSALANWCCQGSVPVIVRTKNGIDYEEVFVCREYIHGASEVELAVKDDRMYIIVRTAAPELKSATGVFLGVYSLDGKCIRNPYQVGDIESRPDMLVYNDKVYAMYNIKPNLIDKATGNEIPRSRVRLAELDSDGTILRAWEYAAPYSMQYFQLDTYKGKLYLSYIEDRYDRSCARKGHLSFVEVNM